MVPYTGKNSSKQTIETKTICFCCKNFAICPDDCYPYFTDLYCTTKYSGVKATKNLTSRSVSYFILEIDNCDNKEVFFENWFTSLSFGISFKGASNNSNWYY